MNKVINIFNKHHVSISFTSASSNKMVDIWSPIGFYFQRIHSVQASIFSIRSRSNKAQNWLDCVPIVPHFTFHCIQIFLHDFRPDVSWSLINRRCFFNGLNSNKFASWKNNKVLNLPFVVLQNGKLRFAHSMHEAYVVLYQHAHFILSLSEQTKKKHKNKNDALFVRAVAHHFHFNYINCAHRMPLFVLNSVENKNWEAARKHFQMINVE